jgi:Transmembrane secretion effector
MAGAVEATRRGYGAVLRVPGIRAVYVAHAVSMAGSVAAEVALSIVIFQRTGSAFLSALVLVCSFLPYAVGGTMLSAIADRYPARRVLVSCDLISAACIVVMLIPGLPVFGLLGLLLAIGTAAPVFQGARSASLAQLLDTDTFPVGRSILRAISQTMVLAGFALGSVAVATVGSSWMLAADAISFVTSAALIRYRTPVTAAKAPSHSDASGSLIRASADGARYLMRTPSLRRLILLSWSVPAFGSAADGLAVAYTAETGTAVSAAGALFTGFAAGTVVAEVLVARLSAIRRRTLLLPLLLASQLPMVAFLAIPGIAIAAGLLVICGAGFASYQGLDPLILAATDDDYRGRLFSLQSGGLMTVQGIGIAVAGGAGTLLQPSVVIAAAGILGTISVLILARRAVPRSAPQ